VFDEEVEVFVVEEENVDDFEVDDGIFDVLFVWFVNFVIF